MSAFVQVMTGTACLLFLLIALLRCIRESRERAALIRQGLIRPPCRPFTDDQFLAACGPSADPEIALRVRKIISAELDIPAELIHPDQRFIEDLCCD